MKIRTILWVAVAMSIAVSGCTVASVGSPVASPSSPLAVAVSSPSPRATAKPTVKPTRTAAPTPTATPQPSPSSGVPSLAPEAPGTPHVDPELEAFLPVLVARTPLARFSVGGSVFTSASEMCILICGDEPYRYAKELGVAIEDVTVAFAVADSLAIGMIGYRARGADTDRLIPARIAMGGYTGHGGLYHLPVTVAGRPAMYLDAGMGTNGEYLMTRHDALFIVLGEAPSKGDCRLGSCASLPPGPWTVPAYVTEALGGVP